MNKHIKQLIENIFNDNFFDDINDISLADELKITDENSIITWLNQYVIINNIDNKNEKNFQLNDGIVITYENNIPNVIIDKTPNNIQIKSLTFTAPIPKWFNISYINSSVKFANTELGNMPKNIKGSVYFKNCDFYIFPSNMSSVQGEIIIQECNNIVSLSGLETLKELLSISVYDCNKFETTKGISQSVTCLWIEDCQSFNKLEDLPEGILNQITLINLPSLSSLNGCPRAILNDLYITLCPLITTLKGAPDYIGGLLKCTSCGLTKLEIPNMRVWKINVNDNKLTSLEGGPKEVSSHYFANNNRLKVLNAENTKVTGYDSKLYVIGNRSLKTIENAPLGISPKNIIRHKSKQH